ncbi:MAG: site-specific integrase [Magnetococcales bacterium]|nr:site-specific integrase [Magnetococcales bacterium]
MKLTKTQIDRFEYQGKQSKGGQYSRDVRWDDVLPGFGVRILPTGKKSFVLSYRHAGRKRLITLGKYGVLTLEQARAKAKKELGAVLEGEDPLEERQKEVRGSTMGDLCREYWDRHGSQKKTSRNDRRRIDKIILPRWKNIQINAITRSDIALLHHEYGKQAPYEANLLLAQLRIMFNKALEWGMSEHSMPNPCNGIKKHPEEKRDRWVSPEELPKLAEAIDQEQNIYARAALWMYLLTGLRKGELLAARWDDVDWSRKELKITEHKTIGHSGKAHYVPLTAPALALLKNLPVEDGNPYILPGRKSGKHLVNISKAWNRVRKAAGIEDVRLHDLRRTVGSWMAQAGNSLHLIGKVLNHSNVSTTQVYARFGQDMVRDALEAHGKNLMAVAGGGKPVLD